MSNRNWLHEEENGPGRPKVCKHTGEEYRDSKPPPGDHILVEERRPPALVFVDSSKTGEIPTVAWALEDSITSKIKVSENGLLGLGLWYTNLPFQKTSRVDSKLLTFQFPFS